MKVRRLRNGILVLAMISFGMCGGNRACAVQTVNLGPGTFPDVAFWDGFLWCAVQQGEFLVLYQLTADLKVVDSTAFPLGPGALAFARLTVWDDRLWLAYRGGGPDYAAILWEASQGAESFGPAGGNDPVAVGNGMIAWQDPQFNVFLRQLEGGDPVFVRPGAPTGLSRILADGEVILVDEDRFAVPGGTRPSWAGDIVVVEALDELADLVRRDDGAELRLFQGQESFTPRAAADDDGYAVATWGQAGVRLATFTANDFGPGARPSPDAPGP